MSDRLILHPILLALFPVLALFAHNQSELLPSVMGYPLLANFAASLLLWGLAWVLCRNPRKAALLASCAIGFFYTYAHVFNPLLASVLGRHRYVLLVWMALLALALLMILRTKRDLAPVTSLLNNISLIMVILPIGQTALYQFNGRSNTADVLAQLSVDERLLPQEELLGYAPDIYYFVPDRYAGQKTLDGVLGYDNSGFLNYLQDKGFFVAAEGRANYSTTPLSLASALNMDYLKDAGELVGEDCTDSSVTFGLIGNNRVQRLLRQRGYQYIHLGSRWEPTRTSEFATENIVYGFPISEFATELLLTTAAWPLLYNMLDVEHVHREQVLFKLEKFHDVIPMPGPKFVFAHLLVPHTPYVFDEDGGSVTPEELSSRTEQESYLRQVTFFNNRMKALIDEILERSERLPVIIIQADEGPHFEDTFEQRMSPETIKMKSYILNAFYVPGVSTAELSPSMTPVNNFRFIFNSYFGAGFPLLEDRSYWFEDPTKPYRFVDVTDIRY